MGRYTHAISRVEHAISDDLLRNGEVKAIVGQFTATRCVCVGRGEAHATPSHCGASLEEARSVVVRHVQVSGAPGLPKVVDDI